MKLNAITLVSISALMLIVGCLVIQFSAKKKYDEGRRAIYSLSTVEIDDDQFLSEVVSSWSVKLTECPDEAMTSALELVNEDVSVDGIAGIMAHEVSSFSFINNARNKRETIHMMVKSTIIPETVDGAFHKGEDIAYIKYRNNLVEVYKETKDGIKNTLYYKK